MKEEGLVLEISLSEIFPELCEGREVPPRGKVGKNERVVGVVSDPTTKKLFFLLDRCNALLQKSVEKLPTEVHVEEIEKSPKLKKLFGKIVELDSKLQAVTQLFWVAVNCELGLWDSEVKTHNASIRSGWKVVHWDYQEQKPQEVSRPVTAIPVPFGYAPGDA